MIDPTVPLGALSASRVLVTGAAGSIGSAVVAALTAAEVTVHATDLGWSPTVDDVDVRDGGEVESAMERYRPTHILHMAGAKHAPEGELDPGETARTNIDGTANVLRAAHGARVVTASTCKACDPETAYGASKLIAERMTLNAGGSVARFYNVPESSGNVFRLWEQLPPDAPIPVTLCSRYFVSLADAVALVLWAAVLEPGRYTIDPGQSRRMADIAAEIYPGREQERVPPRRGDRLIEPLKAEGEWIVRQGGLWRVHSPHDAALFAVPPLVAA